MSAPSNAQCIGYLNFVLERHHAVHAGSLYCLFSTSWWSIAIRFSFDRFYSLNVMFGSIFQANIARMRTNEMIIVCNWAIVCILFNYIGFVWTLNSHFQPSTSFPYAQFSVHESVNSLRTYVSQSVLACDEIDYFFLSFDKWVVSTHALKYCVMHKHSDINLNYVRLYVQFGARSVNRNETDRWNERQTNETEIESTISRKWKKLLF